MATKKEVIITCNATNVKAVIEGLERGMAALAKEEENLLNVIKQRGFAENDEKKRLKELEKAMDAMRTNVQKNREEQKKLGIVYFSDSEDFFSLKGTVETLFEACSVPGTVFRAADRPYFQPGQSALILASDRTSVLGEIGRLHPDIAAKWDLDCPVYMAELSMSALMAASTGVKKFTPLPRFPVVQRDLAVVVDDRTENAVISRIILETETGCTISDVELFDVYAGIGIQRQRRLRIS